MSINDAAVFRRPRGLPETFFARPATMADQHAAYELVAGAEQHDDGLVEIDEGDIEAAWSAPGANLATMTALVFDGDSLVGMAELSDGGRAEVAVAPGARGRGIGASLLRWTEDQAPDLGIRRMRQIVSDKRSDAVTLLRANGYEPTSTAWILEVAFDGPPPTPEVPAGIRIRPYEPGRDDREVYRLIEDAFAEWGSPEHRPMTFEDWHRTPCGGDATVTVVHSRSRHLAEITRSADILIAAIGQPEFVRAEHVRDGAVVIDVGINRVDDPTMERGYRLVGDVAFAEVSEKASAITPVPGGVGPMTIAMLMANTVRACRQMA